MEENSGKNKVNEKLLEKEQQEEKKAETKDASFTFIVFILNIAFIGFTCQSAMTKEMLMHGGVKIYEFCFFRSFFNMCCSAVIIKQAKVNFFSDIKKD